MKIKNVHEYLIQGSTGGFGSFLWVFTADDFRKELASLKYHNKQDKELEAIYQALRNKESNFATFENVIHNSHYHLYPRFLEISRQIASNLIAKKYGKEMMLLEMEPGKFETYITSSGKFVTLCQEAPFHEEHSTMVAAPGTLLSKLRNLVFFQDDKNTRAELGFFRNGGRSIFVSNFAGYKELEIKLKNHDKHAHEETGLSKFIKSHYEKLSTRELLQELMSACQEQSLDNKNLVEVVLKAINQEKLLTDMAIIKKGSDFEKITISDFLKHYRYDAKSKHFYQIDTSKPGIKHKIMFSANKKEPNYHTVFLPGDDGYKKLLKHNSPKLGH